MRISIPSHSSVLTGIHAGGSEPYAILVTAATSSPALTFMIRTPWVARPYILISLAKILINTSSLFELFLVG
jgi:hypothetical protein